MSAISIQGLTKDFVKGVHVLDNLSIEIEDGSFTILLGPSGCGKSTLLRIIAGLEKPTSGRVLMDGEDMTGAEPCDRNLAMVFQNYALYPHMSALQNVEYGLKLRRVPKAERTQTALQALELVGLSDQAKKRPAEMSGGQRQRVALARAIVKRPGVYLMDEPLSNLDAKLRGQMRESISRLHEDLGATFVYVTHDQVEAMSMGSHIILLNGGKIAQQGSPRELYESPSSAYVAGFVGAPPANILDLGEGSVAIRPERVSLSEPDGDSVAVSVRLSSREQLGDSTILSFDSELGELRAKVPCIWDSHAAYQRVWLPSEALMFFGDDGNRVPATAELMDRLVERAA